MQLGFTAGVVGWSAVVLPLLPSEVLISAAFEHATLTLTGVAVVLFSAFSLGGYGGRVSRRPVA